MLNTKNNLSGNAQKSLNKENQFFETQLFKNKTGFDRGIKGKMDHAIFSDYYNDRLNNLLNDAQKDKKGNLIFTYRNKDGQLLIDNLNQYFKDIKDKSKIENLNKRKKKQYEKEIKDKETYQNDQLKALNETAVSIYGQQVKYGNFLYKYLTNIPNILTRVLNTALKFYLGLNLVRFIYKGVRWAFGISGNIKDGIVGFFNKLVDSNANQLTAGGINLYDRIMKFIFGEKYKDHKDMANNVEKNGLLKTIGLFLVDQIKKGFKWLWDSGTIITVLKYYILFQGARELIGMMPGMVYGIVSFINNATISIGASMVSWATPSRLLSIPGFISTLFGGGFLLFGTKLFSVLAGVLPFLFRHAKLITFIGFLFKHMFDNWFATLNNQTQEAFNKLKLDYNLSPSIDKLFALIVYGFNGTRNIYSIYHLADMKKVADAVGLTWAHSS